MSFEDYHLMFQSRTPNATGGVPPTITELGTAKVKENLSWSRTIWEDGGEINFSLQPDEIPDNIAERLVDLFYYPTEVKLYKGSTLAQQCVVTSCQVQGPTVTVQCRGLMYYTRYWFITSDLTYTLTDQYTIVKNLINHHQNKTYGHFGIDASGIGASGVTLERGYKANRLHNIYQEIDRLAQRQNGFDYYVSIDDNRDLILTDRRGVDRSASVFLDSRGIFSPQISMSAAQRQVGSQALAVGHSFSNNPVTGATEDAAALAAFGRAQIAEHFDTVPTQAEIDDIVAGLLDTSKNTIFSPGAFVMYPVVGAVPIDDFDVGDTVTWYYDAGLGVQNVSRDLQSFQVSVNEDGEEKLNVEFV